VAPPRAAATSSFGSLDEGDLWGLPGEKYILANGLIDYYAVLQVGAGHGDVGTEISRPAAGFPAISASAEAQRSIQARAACQPVHMLLVKLCSPAHCGAVAFQVDDDASTQEIKTAYRTLARSCHPDYLGDAGHDLCVIINGERPCCRRWIPQPGFAL